MSQSVNSGPAGDKTKGYWQAIANYNHAVATYVGQLCEDEKGCREAAEVCILGDEHPKHGQFLQQLAAIHEAISETYGVPVEEVAKDIDDLGDADLILQEIAWYGQDV